MAGVCAVLALVGACIAVAFGVVRLFPAYRRCADLAANRRIRDAAFVARARADLLASGWTTADEHAYQCLRAQQGVTLRAVRGEFHG